jgi:hypothetical protein
MASAACSPIAEGEAMAQRNRKGLGYAFQLGRAAAGLLVLGLALWALVVALPLRAAWAEMSDYRISDASGIYCGNQRLYTKPCVVKADRIYRSISEYREILDKGLTDKDVQYHFLMKKASERFTEAVKRMSKDLALDLVGEVGSIKAAKTGIAEPPEKTDDVISRLS